MAGDAPKYRGWKKLLILPPFALGVGIIVMAMGGGRPPAREEAAEPTRPVRVVEAVSGALTPTVEGYGLIRPSRVWEAVAQVAAPVVWINPEAQTGALLPAGSEIIRLDPTEFEVELAQAEAELEAGRVKLASTAASLALEEQSVALLKADLERKRNLFARGAIASLAVETAERAALDAETQAQSLRNTLAETRVNLRVLEARVAAAELDLARASIAAPFDIRVTEKLTEVSQYAAKGAVLLRADGTEAAEATAHIAGGRLGPLVRGSAEAGWMVASGEDARGGPLDLDATVILRRGDHEVRWTATVSRVAASIDPLTQTVGIVVSVAAPYASAEPGRRPPLTPNSFVEIQLSGAPIEGRAIIPATAVRQGRVYVASSEDRLEIRAIETGLRQGRFVIVTRGIAPGDRVVVSDLIPAVEGMLLAPRVDRALSRAMREAAGLPVGSGAGAGRGAQ